MSYDFREVEPRWQATWEERKSFRADESSGKPKYYLLEQFPYPSGSGLHMGHCLIYTIGDTISRYLRLQGYEVLHPTGWDAFGLPTENHAIKEGIHPAEITLQNTDTFRRQMKAMGWSYDWDREIDTTSPGYVRWTQWIWKELYRKGLAYKARASINWCDSCKVGVAHEEVDASGTHERCGSPVRRREMEQWMFRITEYAQSLLDGLETLPEWPRGSVEAQKNWIGRSAGAEVDFSVVGQDATIRVYTTRPDTLFGATYMVLAPEHPLVDSLASDAQREAVEAYRTQAARKSDLARTDLAKDKTGVFTGGYALNPVNGARIPIWVADYVLISYGTGAIMSVPGHDTRDFEFAQAFDLPIVRVLHAPGEDPEAPLEEAYTGAGVLCHSSSDAVSLDGLAKDEAIERISDWLEAQGLGSKAVRFKLRDWVFARQRYWGEPFPLVFDAQGEAQLMDDSELPLLLPQVESYQPTDTGESPLAAIEDWVATPAGRRETDTMPNWAGSSWYWLRFMDPHNEEAFADLEKQKFWGQVDLYVGGTEHLVLHDLYSRFWNHALHDLGHVAVREPFKRLLHQGMVLGSDGRKMSKSLGNGVSPDDVLGDYGADVLRLHLNFLGPPEATKLWNSDGLRAMRRFLDRVHTVFSKGADVEPSRETLQQLHVCIKGVTADYEAFSLNTVLAKLMELTNHLMKLEEVPREVLVPMMIMLSPQAPHFAEELGQRLGVEGLVSEQPFPSFDEELTVADEITVVVQINGKLRGRLSVPKDCPKDEVEALALASPNVVKHLEGKTVRRVIVVPGRLVNIVVS